MRTTIVPLVVQGVTSMRSTESSEFLGKRWSRCASTNCRREASVVSSPPVLPRTMKVKSSKISSASGEGLFRSVGGSATLTAAAGALGLGAGLDGTFGERLGKRAPGAFATESRDRHLRRRRSRAFTNKTSILRARAGSLTSNAGAGPQDNGYRRHGLTESKTTNAASHRIGFFHSKVRQRQ